MPHDQINRVNFPVRVSFNEIGFIGIKGSDLPSSPSILLQRRGDRWITVQPGPTLSDHILSDFFFCRLRTIHKILGKQKPIVVFDAIFVSACKTKTLPTKRFTFDRLLHCAGMVDHQSSAISPQRAAKACSPEPVFLTTPKLDNTPIVSVPKYDGLTATGDKLITSSLGPQSRPVKRAVNPPGKHLGSSNPSPTHPGKPIDLLLQSMPVNLTSERLPAEHEKFEVETSFERTSSFLRHLPRPLTDDVLVHTRSLQSPQDSWWRSLVGGEERPQKEAVQRMKNLKPQNILCRRGPIASRL